jgi:Ca2+-binding RTX toxin-like protein
MRIYLNELLAAFSIAVLGFLVVPGVAHSQAISSEGTIVTAIPEGNLGGGLFSGSSASNYDFVAASGAGKFLVISDGEVIWSQTAVYPTMIAGTDAGIVYVGTSNNGYSAGTLTAVNFLTNTTLWTYTGGFNSHFVKIDGDGNLVFVMTDFASYMTPGKTRLVKLDADTGSEIWSVYPFGNNPGDPSFGSDSPVEVASDGYILAPKYTPYLMKYDTLGNLMWTVNWGTEEAIGDTQRIIADGQFLYLVSIDRGNSARFLVHKLNSDGTLVKTKLFSAADLGFPTTFASGVWGFDLAIDSGSLLVSGILYVASDAGAAYGASQVFLAKLSLDLDVLDARDIGGEGDEVVGARGTNLNVAADGTVTVFATGAGTSSIFGAPLASSNNYLVFKFQDQSGIFLGTSGQDLITSTAGSDELFGFDGNDTLNGDPVTGAVVSTLRLANSTVASSSDDKFTGGNGNDTIRGGVGSDTAVYSGNFSGYTISYNSSTKVLTVTDKTANRDGTDTVTEVEKFQFADGTRTAASLTVNVINGTSSANTLNGTAGVDEIFGLGGNDTLNGAGGDDLLDGGTGRDTMNGGDGNDVYVVDSTSDVVTEGSGANGGNDTVRTSLSSYTLPANVENVIYIGTSTFSGTGNTLVNSLTGGANADSLSGSSAADVMIGGGGNDSYTFDANGDTAIEGVSAGTDSVTASVTVTLADNVENLTLTGSSNLSGTGNSLSNSLTGNSGVNTLTGGGGSDTLNGSTGGDGMYGGEGDDNYTVDNAADITGEDAGKGTDRVSSSVTRTLADHLEHLTLTGSSAINGTGNSLNNRIVGNSGANTLSGAAGEDVLIGAAGNDIFYGNTSSNVGTEIDTVSYEGTTAAVTFNLGLTTAQATGGSGSDRVPNGSIENLIGGAAADTLTGTSGDNRIEGAAGNDKLNGLTGADVLVGNAGLDTIDCGSETTNAVDTVVYLFSGDSAVGTNRDQILNFKTGDKIDLSAIDANSSAANDQAFTFNTTTAKANSIWFAVSGSDVIVRGDVNGNTTADFEILVKGMTSITAAQFVM